MINTNASDVIGPTPGCVLSRDASGLLSDACSTAWSNLATAKGSIFRLFLAIPIFAIHRFLRSTDPGLQQFPTAAGKKISNLDTNIARQLAVPTPTLRVANQRRKQVNAAK